MVSISDEVKNLLDLSGLENNLGLPKDFIKSIMRSSDDWSFIIKTHALFESAITHWVTEELNRPELELLVSRLSFLGKTGKLAFAKSLGLIDPLHMKPLEVICII